MVMVHHLVLNFGKKAERHRCKNELCGAGSLLFTATCTLPHSPVVRGDFQVRGRLRTIDGGRWGQNARGENQI